MTTDYADSEVLIFRDRDTRIYCIPDVASDLGKLLYTIREP